MQQSLESNNKFFSLQKFSVLDDETSVLDDVFHGIDAEVVNKVGIIGDIIEDKVHFFTDFQA